MSRRHRLSWGAALARHAALALICGFILLPFVWMLSTSLKGPTEIFQSRLNLWPEDWHAVENYSAVFERAPFGRFLANSAIICAGILTLQLLIAVPCGYALAKLRFPGRDGLFALVLAGLLIPTQAVAIPVFVLLYSMGLLDTYGAMILPSSISVFGIFLFRQFFKPVPDELVYAGRLDGMSEAGIVWRIMLPLALPAILAFATFSVSSHWNDLFWPLIVVRSPEIAPAPLGLLFFRDEEFGTAYGPLMAAALVVTAPLIIAFLLAQRWFIAGIRISTEKEVQPGRRA